jgi:hypothetical protein
MKSAGLRGVFALAATVAAASCGSSGGNASPDAASSGASPRDAAAGEASAREASATASSSSGSPGSSSGSSSSGTVGVCNNLAAPGALENITPPQLNPQSWCWPGSMGCANGTYGAHYFALDPNHAGTILLGTSSLGIWKSTDCGATWVHIDTGTAGPALDTGRNWSIVIDPTDSDVVYTCAGYGGEADGVSSLGVFKSTDGGVNWQQLFPQDILSTTAGSIEKIAMDPTNHLHLLVSFHGACANSPNGGGTWGCLAETRDAGTTWTLANSAEEWTEGDGQTILDDKTWFFGSLFGTSGVPGGIWRTTNGGASWDNVYVGDASAVYIAPDGTFFSAGGQGVLRSSDGVSWTRFDSSPQGASVNGSCPITSDGKSLFASGGSYGGTEPSTGWYASAPLGNLTNWTPAFNYVPMVAGAENLAYDPAHHLLYSSNLTAGLWRVVVP